MSKKKKIITVTSIILLLFLLIGFKVVSDNIDKKEEDVAKSTKKQEIDKDKDKKEETAQKKVEKDIEPEEEKEIEVVKTVAEQSGLTDVNKDMFARTYLTVRSDATVDSEKFGVLDEHQKIHITGEVKNGWVRIEYKDKEGYVNSEYLISSLPKKESKPTTVSKPKSNTNTNTQSSTPKKNTTINKKPSSNSGGSSNTTTQSKPSEPSGGGGLTEIAPEDGEMGVGIEIIDDPSDLEMGVGTP